MEKSRNTGRKWCFGLYVFVQLVLIFCFAIWVAPYGQTLLRRYPHVYENNIEMMRVKIWSFYVLGILICPMLVVLAIFEILLGKKIDTKLEIGLHIVAIINGLSALIFAWYDRVHYALPLTIGLVTDILLIVGSVIWFEKLDRRYRHKSVEVSASGDEKLGIVACGSKEEVVRKVLFGLAFCYITIMFFVLTLHIGHTTKDINLIVHGYIYLPILLTILVLDLLLNKKICPPLTVGLAVLEVAKAIISVLAIDTILLSVAKPLSIVTDVLFAIGCIVWFVMLGLHYKKRQIKA